MKFVVCAPRYDPVSGGAIVLYKLARVLRSLGHDVKIWPLHRIRHGGFISNTMKQAFYATSRLYRPRFAPHDELVGSIATHNDLADSVVVYPEIIHGNPLKAARPVHWNLYKPGESGVPWKSSPGELYFCFQEVFNVHCEDMNYGGVLFVLDWMTDIYKQTNFGARQGVCHMVRKGRGRSDLPVLYGLDVVDGMDHATLARTFNQKQACYFYDLYTAYSEYAALCGCVPIVVPPKDLSREMWDATQTGRTWVAFGEEDAQRARGSNKELAAYIARSEHSGIQSVRDFVEVVRTHFGDAHAF